MYVGLHAHKQRVQTMHAMPDRACTVKPDRAQACASARLPCDRSLTRGGPGLGCVDRLRHRTIRRLHVRSNRSPATLSPRSVAHGHAYTHTTSLCESRHQCCSHCYYISLRSYSLRVTRRDSFQEGRGSPGRRARPPFPRPPLAGRRTLDCSIYTTTASPPTGPVPPRNRALQTEP